jgi:hypothetical protein
MANLNVTSSLYAIIVKVSGIYGYPRESSCLNTI